MTIRPMRPEDAADVAALSGELGYPSSPLAIERRLRAMAGRDDLAALVAQNDTGEVIGWIQVHAELLVESDPTAVIGGLVVRDGARGRGVGRALLSAAEAWAAGRGFAGMRVRSNVVRERAHRFYERLGYARTKTQHNFTRPLGPPGGPGRIDP